MKPDKWMKHYFQLLTIERGFKEIRSHFWIRTRQNVTSYQSKRFTGIVINVRTLSQWSN